MAKEDQYQQGDEELQPLNRSHSASPDSDIVVYPASQSRRASFVIPRRQSSLARPRENGNPRTQNRVRFDVADSVHSASAQDEDDQQQQQQQQEEEEHRGGDDWLDDEDYMSANSHANRYRDRRGHSGQRAPLLTGIEAPAVTLAESDFNPDDLLESARPKSGMKSAFMNMANSIMYVHVCCALPPTRTEKCSSRSASRSA